MHAVSASFVVLVFASAACSERERASVMPSVDDRPAEAAPQAPTPSERNPETPESSPSPTPAATSSSTPGPPASSLDEAMRGFMSALVQKDVERFLVYFSRSKPFRYIGTIEVKQRVQLVDYEDLSRALRARDVDRGWYSILFDGGPDDSFAQTVADPERRAWRRVDERKFVPPGDDADSTLFVIWRKERDRWVVDAIAYPGA